MEEIQTGSFRGRNPFSGKNFKFAKIYIIAVIVLVCIAGCVYLIERSGNKTPVYNYYVPSNLTPDQKALYLADNNHYQAATQVYKQELSTSKDTNSKLNVYFLLTALAIRFKDYLSAQQYADNAKSLDSRSSVPYVALAQLAAAEGKKVTAKLYWQQAINYLNSNQPGYNLIKEEYQQNIAGLK